MNWGLLVPILALSIPIIAIYTKHQQKMMEIQSDKTAEKAAQYAAQIERLENRVRTLERVITDQGYETALEIEALRDERDSNESTH